MISLPRHRSQGFTCSQYSTLSVRGSRSTDRYYMEYRSTVTDAQVSLWTILHREAGELRQTNLFMWYWWKSANDDEDGGEELLTGHPPLSINNIEYLQVVGVAIICLE